MQFDNSRPVWLQLVEEFTRLIASGQWKAEEKAPSTRELALTYRVNPNTVQKALAEMDRRGLTRSERASGRIILANDDAARALKHEESALLVDRMLDELEDFGLTKKEIQTLIAERLQARAGQEPAAHSETTEKEGKK